MDCREIRSSVLDGGIGHDEVVADHLCKCDECAGFARTFERFVNAKPDTSVYKIPRALDDSVTKEAYAWIGSAPPNPSDPAPSVRRLLRSWPFIFACSACVFLVAWLVVSILYPGDVGEVPMVTAPEVFAGAGPDEGSVFDSEPSEPGRRFDQTDAGPDVAEDVGANDAELEFMLLEYHESDADEKEAISAKLRMRVAALYRESIEHQRDRLEEAEKRLSEMKAALDDSEKRSEQIIDDKVKRLIEKSRRR
ncbi:MAG: hypothetical protein JW808_04685 [Victivallales bacterium]|nr:hypothetical protein [Victivallales bacterium]